MAYERIDFRKLENLDSLTPGKTVLFETDFLIIKSVGYGEYDKMLRYWEEEEIK